MAQVGTCTYIGAHRRKVDEMLRVDLSLYTKESVDAFSAVLKEAQAALTRDEMKQSEVDDLLAKLNAAYDNLVRKNGSIDVDPNNPNNPHDPNNPGEPGSVETGDAVNILPILSLTVLSLVGVIVFLNKKRTMKE